MVLMKIGKQHYIELMVTVLYKLKSSSIAADKAFYCISSSSKVIKYK